MATLKFEFDTGSVPLSRIVDAICSHYDYQSEVRGETGELVPNTETKAQFARRMVKEHIIKIVKNEDTESAVRTAKQAVTSIDLI